MQLDAPAVSWIVDYLTNISQFVSHRQYVSEMVVRNTGGPQGTPMPPFLVSVCTLDFQYTTSSFCLKDGSSVVGYITNGDMSECSALAWV